MIFLLYETTINFVTFFSFTLEWTGDTSVSILIFEDITILRMDVVMQW